MEPKRFNCHLCRNNDCRNMAGDEAYCHACQPLVDKIRELEAQLQGYKSSVFNTLQHCGHLMNFTFGTPTTPEKYNCQKCDVEITRDVTDKGGMMDTKELENIISKGSIEEIERLVMTNFHRIKHTVSFGRLLTRFRASESRVKELEEVFTRVKHYTEEQNDWVLSGLLEIKRI